jgi:hypothetical protein
MGRQVFRCLCVCHDAGDWGVVVTDAVEAVIACKRCENDHVAVFKPDFPPPKDWTPDADSTGDEGRET